MKRYRVLGADFDSRARILDIEIEPDWEEHIKAQWEENKEGVRQGLEAQYGKLDHEAKVQNFTDFGMLPFSVIAYHNRFLRQIRDAFTVGAYYPALTGAAALGERILNHLMIRLRDYFKATPEYKTVYGKSSFQDWEKAITVLEAWSVLQPDAAKALRDLAELRNREAVHFNPDIDTDDRAPALRAGKLVSDVVRHQFAAFGPQPWYIKDTPGVMYVRRDAESEPFVKEFILPSCVLVGPRHKIVRFEPPEIDISDDKTYPDRQLTDEEFVAELKAAKEAGDGKA